MTVQNQDTAARDWAAEYRRLAPRLVRYAYRLLGSADEAADVVQDAFVAAMRSEGSLHQDSAFDAWLYRIVSNAAVSTLRRRKLRRLLPFATEETDGRQRSIETGALVRAALQHLPAAQAVALVLAHHEGFTRAEIARITGVPVDTVRTRLARGRKAFIAIYRQLEG